MDRGDILAVASVGCWFLWGWATVMAANRLSPLMMQIVVAYAQSALAPALLIFLKLRGQHPSWDTPGSLWAIGACLAATAASMALAGAVDWASRAPTALP